MVLVKEKETVGWEQSETVVNEELADIMALCDE